MDNAGLYDCQTQLSRMDVDAGHIRTEVNYLIPVLEIQVHQVLYLFNNLVL